MAEEKEQYLPFVPQMIVIAMLLILGGVFSGLSLGLMQMDPNRLQIVAKAGTKKMQKYAKIIYPIRKNGNYLLCVLLVGNVLTNNTLAILLEQLTGGIVAIVASTGSIVVFGEIIPQALCGRHPLFTGAYTVWITWFFYVILWPVAYPVSLLLNFLLGKEIGVFYLRDELSELLKITQEYSDLDREELGILGGGLSLKNTCVDELMTPINVAVMIESTTLLTRDVLDGLKNTYFSRIPVYLDNKDNIIGLLMVHDLLAVALNLDEKNPVMAKTKMTPVSPARLIEGTQLTKAFQEFKTGDAHMALVFNAHQHITGLLTVSDLTEFVLGTRFPDEKLLDQHRNLKQQNTIDVFRSRSSTPCVPYEPSKEEREACEQEDINQPLIAKVSRETTRQTPKQNVYGSVGVDVGGDTVRPSTPNAAFDRDAIHNGATSST
eukprot:m.149421 g.149421  ORF g.149421 m.149421 type:complete len:434 (-) comp30656_c0_seq1:47-1348(-)